MPEASWCKRWRVELNTAEGWVDEDRHHDAEGTFTVEARAMLLLRRAGE